MTLLFLKAKKAQIGEIRHRKNGPHQKVGPNKWIRVVKKGKRWIPLKEVGKKEGKTKETPSIKSKEFKKWFGDWESGQKKSSIVVGKDGKPTMNEKFKKPIMVYHGSKRKGRFKIFDKSYVNEGNTFANGFYFTESKTVAKVFATEKGHVKKVYLNIRNPYIVGDKKMVIDLVKRFNNKSIVDKFIKYSKIEYQIHPKDMYKIPLHKRDKYKELTKEYHWHFSLARALKEHYKYKTMKETYNHIDKKIKEAGYDGASFNYPAGGGEVKKAYVAFEPTQIKAINAKEFNPDNPNIYKSMLLKAKRAQIGEVRHRKSGPHQKVGPNKWQRVKKVGGKWVSVEKKGKTKKKKKVLPGKKIPTTGLSEKKERKSTKSKYYYQVPVKVGKKTMWKKYTTYEEYRKDYPKGPEKGHILVNLNHPSHLRIDPKAEFATVGNKKYMSRAEFLKDYPIPSKAKIKRMVNKGIKSDVKIKPNFRHKDWHPSSKEKFNADTKKYFGVLDAFNSDRDAVKAMYDKERYQREGKQWSVEDYQRRLKEKVEPYKKTKKKPVKKKAEGIMRKGTAVKFIYRGKNIYGKVIGTKSEGKKGQIIKKAVTHYHIEYNLGDKKNVRVVSLKKIKSKVQQKWIKKEDVEREKPARKQLSKMAQDKALKEREEKNIAKKLHAAQKRLIDKDNVEFKTKVLDIMGGEQGLKDPESPINKIIAKRVYEMVGKFYERGIDPFQDLNRKDLLEAGLVGVFDAVLDWNPTKSKLTTFLQSDKAKDYIKNAINDALYVERQQFHKMSPDYKLGLFKLKQVKENMIKEHDKDPDVKDLIKEYRLVYGKKISDRTLSKWANMLKNKRVKNIIEATDERGELDLLEDVVHSKYKTPEEAYLEKEKMERFHAAILNVLPNKNQRHALMLRYRIDESTTGKGMFGEESQYYTREMEDVSKYIGKGNLGKTPEYRNYSEIAKILKLKTFVEAQRLVENAIKTLQKEHEKGNPNLKELEDVMLNKSFEEKRDFIRLYLFKSVFPEKIDTWIEKQIQRAQSLVKSILMKSAA